MLTLVRKGNEVSCNGHKLTIVAQATKGPGKEVVKIEGLAGSNGQKWVSLSRLNEGENVLECKAREVVASQKYVLTETEKTQIADLQKQIDDIIAKAKERYVEKPDFSVDVSKLTDEQRLAHIAIVQKYLESLRA